MHIISPYIHRGYVQPITSVHDTLSFLSETPRTAPSLFGVCPLFLPLFSASSSFSRVRVSRKSIPRFGVQAVVCCCCVGMTQRKIPVSITVSDFSGDSMGLFSSCTTICMKIAVGGFICRVTLRCLSIESRGNFLRKLRYLNLNF